MPPSSGAASGSACLTSGSGNQGDIVRRLATDIEAVPHQLRRQSQAEPDDVPIERRAVLKAQDECVHSRQSSECSQLVAVGLQEGDRDALLFPERDRQPVTQHELNAAGRMVTPDTRVPPPVPAPPDVVRMERGRCQEGVHVERFTVGKQLKLIHASGATLCAALQVFDLRSGAKILPHFGDVVGTCKL